MRPLWRQGVTKGVRRWLGWGGVGQGQPQHPVNIPQQARITGKPAAARLVLGEIGAGFAQQSRQRNL